MITENPSAQRCSDAPGPRERRMNRVKRIVVKIGSSSLTGSNSNKLDRKVINRLARDIAILRDRGLEVAIVTSGAVAAGMGHLGLDVRPRAIADLQAAAAIGQNLLMNTYAAAFKRHGISIGQVLLTADDILNDLQRYLNVRNTFRCLFSFGTVPVINENDSVATAELKLTIGENDSLAAYVANLIHAELLVILSDVDGLYTSYGRNGPTGELINEVDEDTNIAGAMGKSNSRFGRGGMKTKIRAARLLMLCGEMTVIANARKHTLVDIVRGHEVGTFFVPSRKRMTSRKRWIGFASPCKGTVVIDKGTERAIRKLGKSLFSTGVVDYKGEFEVGDVIRVATDDNYEVARGLTRYNSLKIGSMLKILDNSEIVLNRECSEVINRGDLVLF